MAIDGTKDERQLLSPLGNPPSMSNAATRNQLQLASIAQLDQVIDGHLRWISRVNRTLLCKGEPDADLIAIDAHRSCAFGKWYYDLDMAQWEPWAASLGEIAVTHEHMHTLAARQTLKHTRDEKVSIEDYDRLTEAAYRFVTAIKALQSQLIHEVCLVDPLTGAWNRGSLFQKIAEEYNRMGRHGEPCCLCMMDIDHFKRVNDSHGHAVGDHVLRTVVAIAARHLRSYDSLFRYGGEEFLFCLPMEGLTEARIAMERVRTDISTQLIPLPNGKTIAITASFGIAEMTPLLSVEENIEAADRALYRAKAGGRNLVCCH